MSQPLVSIIVPVYKTEQYIARCLDSILAQTYRNIEVVVVNDGSPDNAPAIAREYAARDRRIKVVDQENSGLNAARHTGVRNATGEWVCSVDSDDTVPTDAVANLVAGIADDVDIVVEPAFGEGGAYRPEGFSIDEYRRLLIANSYVHFTHAFWGKLYRREILTDHVFDIPNIRPGQDFIENVRISFVTTRRVAMIPQKTYNYSITDTSVSARPTDMAQWVSLYRHVLESIPEELRCEYEECVYQGLHNIFWNNTFNNIRHMNKPQYREAHDMVTAYAARYGTPFTSFRYRWLMRHTCPVLRAPVVLMSRILGKK